MENQEVKLGKLIYLQKEGKDKYGNSRGKYLCFCGKEFIVNVRSVNTGNTKSCGCYRKALLLKIRTKHGDARTKLYNTWTAMRKRCNNKNAKEFVYYGERGINVCKEWNDFIVFKEWALSNGYKSHLTIDRINNNGNYEPKNCRWVTRQIQNINKRSKKNKTGFTGVYLLSSGKYGAHISVNKKQSHLGTFNTPEKASLIYEKAKTDRAKKYNMEKI